MSKSLKSRHSKESNLKNTNANANKLGAFQRLKNWATTQSYNPVILGNKSMALRLHSFFVTSPLIQYFDHTAIFDDYSEKNLLILIGPLSEIQIKKVEKIILDLQSNYKVLYIEMVFEKQTNIEKYIKDINSKLSFLKINRHLITDFVTLDRIANAIREL